MDKNSSIMPRKDNFYEGNNIFEDKFTTIATTVERTPKEKKIVLPDLKDVPSAEIAPAFEDINPDINLDIIDYPVQDTPKKKHEILSDSAMNKILAKNRIVSLGLRPKDMWFVTCQFRK